MKKLLALSLILALLICMLAACSSGESTPDETAPEEDASQQETAEEEEAPAEEEPAEEEPAEEAPAEEEAAEETTVPPEFETITVGLMSGFQPYCYMNDDGTVGGFDVAVVTEAASRLGIELEWLVVPWDSLLISLDSGACQMVSSQLWKTEERLAQYAMSTVPYFESGGQLLVAADNDEVTSLDTLNGEPIGTTVGDSWTTYLETYNEEHDNVLNISYYSEDIATIVQDVANGRVAATLNDPVVIWERVEAQNLEDNVKLVGGLEGSGCCYAAFQKSESGEALRDLFDQAYLEMIEDGTMAEISIEYFGNDYTTNLLDNISEG